MEQIRLGIIGGMGPKATAVFMDKLVDHTAAVRDQDHIDMVVLNHASLPDRTEVILSGEKVRFLSAVEKDIRLLEHVGVANIAIPCNTSHYFYQDMQAMTSIPIIHMVDETLREIARRYETGSKVGVLATNGTLRSGIYRDTCAKYSMRYHDIDDAMQAEVMRIIYEDVKRDNNVSPDKLEAIIFDLIERGECQCVVLACTELSCIAISEAAKAHSIDAMAMLVKRSIELSGKKTVNLD
ncbi:aspartate/glutamate racemase family protein [Cohnella panacarvi]|uniref:aspartate/glutamate racemase family protein n=1 Tax=Cohnella panacarvi TaxID=400776 RepID=UPI00047AF07F|nr:amino acid racemase [Cohnella panacarvi]